MFNKRMRKKFRHQLIQWTIVSIIILFVIELSPYAISPLMLNKPFSRNEFRNELERQTIKTKKSDSDSENNEDVYLGEHVIHPYLGFVNYPLDIHNNFGFLGPDPLVKKSNDTINICLIGGSVAKELFQFSEDYLTERLKESPPFADKEIRLILIALGGFKQPQQLLALNYLISLGAKYDIVINLDGFNEVVLPFSDNLRFGVFPSFPRHWNLYSRKSMNPEAQISLYEQSEIKSGQIKLHNSFSNSFLKYSNMGLLFWKVLDNKKQNQLIEADFRLRRAVRKIDKTYQANGPDYSVKDTSRFFAELVQLWLNSSKQMNALGKTFDFEYFHFLQPNQYFEGSKELTKEEMKIAFKEGKYNYKTAVRKSYPMLRKKGKELVNCNIKFKDLTMIFADEHKTVYNDCCCHFNQYGYNAIADTIAAFILKNQ